ncbi:MAG: hypothetical protein AUJ57_03325 [Zetaproteobacteria bacterium CG1_02_53_45]|nr:MAG: hypothetical protein AUJ57_03325 [Zetaproteobacteria bacterium CG1_02_53_45]
MNHLLDTHHLILMEAAIVEQLRRAGSVELHPTLINAPLIYDEVGRSALADIYQAYIDIALQADIPFLMCTPTWRANRARVSGAKASSCINADAVSFMQQLRDSQQTAQADIKIAGLIGCKNDCYRPEQGLSAIAAEQFHAWQINQLAGAGVDFLMAQTLPAIEEATGIAKAMQATGLPYIISFVVSRDGHLLDGTALAAAVEMIDAITERKPLGYMVNCAYPTFLCAETQPSHLFTRLIGYLANASALDQCELDGAAQLQAEDISDWGAAMLTLNRQFSLKILGGCCGTGAEYLRYIAER